MRITVTYTGPTDAKGSRITARSDDGRQLTRPYDHSSTNPMKDAAEALAGEPVKPVYGTPTRETYRTIEKRSGG